MHCKKPEILSVCIIGTHWRELIPLFFQHLITYFSHLPKPTHTDTDTASFRTVLLQAVKSNDAISFRGCVLFISFHSNLCVESLRDFIYGQTTLVKLLFKMCKFVVTLSMITGCIDAGLPFLLCSDFLIGNVESWFKHNNKKC